MPELQAAVDGRDDVVLVTVAINGKPRLYRRAAKRAGVTAPVLIDPGLHAVKAFGVRAVPTTFLLDGKGHTVKRFIGGYHKADFVAALNKLK